MSSKPVSHFIIIDDDYFNNYICTRSIQTVFPSADIQSFIDPYAMLDHINATCTSAESEDTIIFLDINMPVLNGWEILDKFSDCAEIVKDHCKIFILSSSIANEDKLRAKMNPLVSGYIVKPLTKNQLQDIFMAAEA